MFCCCVLTADLQGNPSRTGGSFPPHRPAGSCCHCRKEKEKKNKRGAFSFQPPRCNKTKGFTFLLCWLHPPIMSLFYCSIITGFEGRKKRNETFHVFCRSGSVSRMCSLFAGLKIAFYELSVKHAVSSCFFRGVFWAVRLMGSAAFCGVPSFSNFTSSLRLMCTYCVYTV